MSKIEEAYSPAVMITAIAELLRTETTPNQIRMRRRDIEAAKTMLRKQAKERDADITTIAIAAVIRVAEIFAPRDFDAEFDHQVKNGLCGCWRIRKRGFLVERRAGFAAV
jgi:hypothetical protein